MEHERAENDWRCTCGKCHVCFQAFDRPYRYTNGQAYQEGCVCLCHDSPNADRWHRAGAPLQRVQKMRVRNGIVICNA